MRIKFGGAESLAEGLKLLETDYNFKLCEKDEDITIAAHETSENIVKVSYKNNKADITYGGKVRFFRGFGHLLQGVSEGKEEFEITERPMFETNGGMFATQTATPKPSMIKEFIRRLAVMGMNTLQIYTETAYDLPGYAYFGYGRGKYTKEEIKDIDAYAQKFGVELVPCIQVTGHMTDFLKYKSSRKYCDLNGVLLTDSEDTYKLIDDMFKFVSECFTSKKINMGCDETMGIGTGAHEALFGKESIISVYCRHIARVTEMAKSYGFKPAIWGDMFFTANAKHAHPDYCFWDETDVDFTDAVKIIPRDLKLIFWEYSRSGENYHIPVMERLEEITDEVMFAGGVKVWQSSVPQYRETLKCMLPALNACKKKKIKNVFVTSWGGGEVQQTASLPGNLIYADFDYTGGYDEEIMKKRCKFILGADWNALLEMEDADRLHNNGHELASYFALYNDPLLGYLDYHFKGLDADNRYKALRESFETYEKPGELMKPLFDFHLKLLETLEIKAEYGIKLKAAYDSGNMEEMKRLKTAAAEIYERLCALKETKYTLWMSENKPQGFENCDMAYGTLLARFKTVQRRIGDYIEGKIDEIGELKQERLPFDYEKFEHSGDDNIFFAPDTHYVFTAF